MRRRSRSKRSGYKPRRTFYSRRSRDRKELERSKYHLSQFQRGTFQKRGENVQFQNKFQELSQILNPQEKSSFSFFGLGYKDKFESSDPNFDYRKNHPYAHKSNFHKKPYFHDPPVLQISTIEKTQNLSSSQIPGLCSTYIQSTPDSQKYKLKIYLPKNTGINYVGLLIGPKGVFQKKLEENTSCKILIRGKGSHKEGHHMNQEDTEEQHVLIIGDSEQLVRKAQTVVEKILTADEDTRNAIRSEQLQAANMMSKEIYKYDVKIEDHLLTPYGPPSPQAYIIPVPNECVGLIIGKGGEQIRHLQQKSGCKIQVAKREIPDTSMRNVFIEGGSTQEKFEFAKTLIESIVEQHKTIQETLYKNGESNPFQGPYTFLSIPNEFTDMLIGANGTTIKRLYQRTGAYIFIPKETCGINERVLQLSGSAEQVDKCRTEIQELIQRFELNKNNKKSLLEEEQEEYRLQIKQEQEEDGEQAYQKDFLFDPYAAAYYERFSKFQPGQNMNLNDLQWPALQSNRYNSTTSINQYKRYGQVYQERYWKAIQASLFFGQGQESMIMGSELTNASSSCSQQQVQNSYSYYTFGTHGSISQDEGSQINSNSMMSSFKRPSQLSILLEQCFGPDTMNIKQQSSSQIGEQEQSLVISRSKNYSSRRVTGFENVAKPSMKTQSFIPAMLQYAKELEEKAQMEASAQKEKEKPNQPQAIEDYSVNESSIPLCSLLRFSENSKERPEKVAQEKQEVMQDIPEPEVLEENEVADDESFNLIVEESDQDQSFVLEDEGMQEQGEYSLLK